MRRAPIPAWTTLPPLAARGAEKTATLLRAAPKCRLLRAAPKCRLLRAAPKTGDAPPRGPLAQLPMTDDGGGLTFDLFAGDGLELPRPFGAGASSFTAGDDGTSAQQRKPIW